jgi:hypothetical protein
LKGVHVRSVRAVVISDLLKVVSSGPWPITPTDFTGKNTAKAVSAR